MAKRLIETCEECGRDQDPAVDGTLYRLTFDVMCTAQQEGYRTFVLVAQQARVICARCIGSDLLRRFKPVSASAVGNVECPRCKAPAGIQCKTENGWGYHPERYDAATRLWREEHPEK